MRFFGVNDLLGEQTTYFVAKDLEDLLLLLKEHDFEGDFNIYEIKLERGRVGSVDWTEPEDVFDRVVKTSFIKVNI